MSTDRSVGGANRRQWILGALISFACALPVHASFHLMQIEQVIGGVNGDTTAQAVQLRMRFAGQNFVAGTELIAYDAAGNNPITLVTFPSGVTNGAAGTRILITTASFQSHETTPILSDFTMTAIPASYLAAGRLVYRKPTDQMGNPLWSVSWGGASYTGPNTGTIDNDADGNFAPPFAGVLPSSSAIALQFTGAVAAMSTNNAADYALTTGAATFTNNAGDSSLVTSGTPSVFGNISTRLPVQTGNNVLIGGFIIAGTQPKKVILRAIGPSLPVAGALANPVLELRDSSGGLIQMNDNWRSDQQAEIIATGIPPSNDLESAIVATLPANNSAYTAIVRGVNNGTGVGLVEAYDLDQTVDSKLANISTRGFVQTGENVLIGGLIVLGQNPLRILVRAIGPSLPVSGALGDPTLELHDGNGALIRANDNWRTDQEAEIIATGIPPTNDLESAIVGNPSPGNYTAIVRGVNGTTGVAVVEAYALN
jgi:hypothetical protein